MTQNEWRGGEKWFNNDCDNQLKSEIADWILNGFIASQQVSIANKCKFTSTSKRISLQEIFFAKMPNNGQ